jgi:hypothetical protein
VDLTDNQPFIPKKPTYPTEKYYRSRHEEYLRSIMQERKNKEAEEQKGAAAK